MIIEGLANLVGVSFLFTTLDNMDLSASHRFSESEFTFSVPHPRPSTVRSESPSKKEIKGLMHADEQTLNGDGDQETCASNATPTTQASNQIGPAAREFLGNFYIASAGSEIIDPTRHSPEGKRRRLLFPGSNVPVTQPLRITAGPSSKKSLLVVQPFDVQEVIMSFLPDQSLAALRATCRHFVETAGRSLVQRTRTRKLVDRPKVVSFIEFLNSRWSPSFGCLVQELRFATGEVKFPEAFYYNPYSAHLGTVVLRAVSLCRNLRVLQILAWRREWNPELFAKILSRLPFLEELSIKIPYGSMHDNTLRELLSRPLRKLVLDGSGTIALPFDALPATLESLELPGARNWSAFPSVVLPSVQRLTICLPMVEDAPSMAKLGRIFPELKHLRLVGSIMQHPYRKHPIHLETIPELHRLRLAYRRGWEAGPDNWPDLQSIAADSPDHLYAIGIPRHVPHISVGSGRMSMDTGFMLGFVAEDARPHSLEYIWGPSREHDEDRENYDCPTVRNIFELLPAIGCLRRFTLTLLSSGWTQWFDNRDVMIDCWLKFIPRSRLTHLLIKDQNSCFAIPKVKENPLGPRRSSADEARLLETEPHSLATRLAKACSTLAWIGFAINEHPLRVWRAQDALGTYRARGVDEVTATMPEDQRWAIFDITSIGDH
ncbi:hypothetical protein FKP32DRAFT_1754464 [Trametes sanguinea]|nr:hypothetical protein FKP32DRAFT_1754464 [Trametes sanguinea]